MTSAMKNVIKIFFDSHDTCDRLVGRMLDSQDPESWFDAVAACDELSEACARARKQLAYSCCNHQLSISTEEIRGDEGELNFIFKCTVCGARGDRVIKASEVQW